MNSNAGNDPFKGYIAAARVQSGVLGAADIAANYVLGPLASAAAVTPAGLTATAGDTQVALTWVAVGNAAGYNVKRSGTSNGVYAVIVTNLTTPGFTNTGLANGTGYYYEVSATNSAGESANSAPVGARPVSAAVPQLGFTLNGGQVQFNWPADHTGWTLQAQTNAPDAGLGGNWVTVPASNNTNQMVLPVSPDGGSVFFRLIYP
jgi:hypothetical protein